MMNDTMTVMAVDDSTHMLDINDLTNMKAIDNETEPHITILDLGTRCSGSEDPLRQNDCTVPPIGSSSPSTSQAALTLGMGEKRVVSIMKGCEKKVQKWTAGKKNSAKYVIVPKSSSCIHSPSIFHRNICA